MKNYILTIAIVLLISKFGLCQDTLTYAMTQNIEYSKKIKNGTPYQVYVCKDGSVLKIGDTLKINEPQGGSSTTKGSFSFKTTKDYAYIYFGHFTLGKALLATPQPLSGQYKNEVCIITEIRVQHSRMSRESVLTPMVYLHNPNAARGFGMQNRTIFSYEMAIEAGEVSNPKRAMTRAEAIAKLKESKDLLELGIMKQHVYDSLKTVLTPIIMQEK